MRVSAELVFRYRDDGAFPHLNCYVADPELGVRLEPGATENIRFGGNRVTSVKQEITRLGGSRRSKNDSADFQRIKRILKSK